MWQVMMKRKEKVTLPEVVQPKPRDSFNPPDYLARHKGALKSQLEFVQQEIEIWSAQLIAAQVAMGELKAIERGLQEGLKGLEGPGIEGLSETRLKELVEAELAEGLKEGGVDEIQY